MKEKKKDGKKEKKVRKKGEKKERQKAQQPVPLNAHNHSAANHFPLHLGDYEV